MATTLAGAALGCGEAPPQPVAPGAARAPLAPAAPDAERSAALGFPEGPGLELIVGHCTACHSAKLVQQNRATRHGWREIIRWMQRTQGFWELDAQHEEQMLDYLATHYGPNAEAEEYRRLPLSPEWLPPNNAEAPPRPGKNQAGQG